MLDEKQKLDAKQKRQVGVGVTHTVGDSECENRNKKDNVVEATGTVKKKRGRPEKKPGYDKNRKLEELMLKAVDYFAEPYDDREERSEEAPTILSVANEMQTTPLRIRKLLITAGYYSTELSRKVQKLHDSGYSLRIMVSGTIKFV